MNHLLRAGLALLLAAVLSPFSRADVVVSAPYVYVRVGQPTVIRVPFVTIVLPGRTYRMKAYPAAPRLAAPALPPAPCDPPSVPVESVPSRIAPPVSESSPMSVKEFASTFKPAPSGGKYEIVLKHTFTGKPVAVQFTLPAGAPKKITAGKLRLEFRYGPFQTVVVRFYRDGSVRTR